MRFFLLILCVSTFLVAAPQAVVFDFGGVLTKEFDRDLVVRFLCDSLHLSKDDFEKVNLEKRHSLRKGKTDEEFWLSFAKEKGISLGTDWIHDFTAIRKKALSINDEMYQVAEELKKKKVVVALLSNVDDRLASFLRRAGLYQPFDPCLLSCDLQMRKPDPKIYEHLLKRLDLPATDVIFIDDKVENVEAAKNMEIDAILFESTAQVRQELEKRGL